MRSLPVAGYIRRENIVDKPTHHITGDGTKISIKNMCLEWNVQRIFFDGISYRINKEWKNRYENKNKTS